MPWPECSKVDERLRFIARLLNGEKMATLSASTMNAPISRTMTPFLIYSAVFSGNRLVANLH